MLDLESVMDYLSPFAKYLGGQPVSNSCPGRRMARIHRRASQLPPTGNGNVSIMAVVDDRSRENAKYPGGGGRRGRKRRGGGSRCILSRPIYIYIYTSANISPLDLPPRELGWSIANNQFGNRRFQSVTSLGREEVGVRRGRRGKEAVSAVRLVVVVLIVSTLDDVSVNIRGGVWNNLISARCFASINFFVERSCFDYGDSY